MVNEIIEKLEAMRKEILHLRVQREKRDAVDANLAKAEQALDSGMFWLEQVVKEGV